MEINVIFNEDNIITMGKMPDDFLSGIICSPPYNLASKRKDCYYNTGYAEMDNLSPDDYLKLRVKEFTAFQRVLKKDAVILYNISHIHENPILPFQLINKVHNETQLTLADVIYWKKPNAIPFQTSPNKLSRIVEPIYVFVNKNALFNFKANKEISKINNKTNQKFYKNYINYIEAKNNDGIITSLKATYSTDMVLKIMSIYFPVGSLIYDPFMGSGTTARACIQYGCDYIGSEIKEEHYLTSIKETFK